MKKLPRIASAESVIYGVLKIVFLDNYEGVVDLRPVIAKGKIFSWLQTPANFAKVAVDEFGHSISWVNAEGKAIELSADGLRRDAERQAEVHRLMVG